MAEAKRLLTEAADRLFDEAVQAEEMREAYRLAFLVLSGAAATIDGERLTAAVLCQQEDERNDRT